MNLRELKNQLLSEIRRREEYSSKVHEIEVSEIDEDEPELENDEPASLAPVHEIELEEDEAERIETLESVQKVEIQEDEEPSIEPSEINKIEKDKLKVPLADSKINFAKDVKKILVNIVHHLDAESSLNPADLRRARSSSKDTSNLFNRLNVNINSEEPALKRNIKETIPAKLKSKFGPVKKWPVRDKTKRVFLNQQDAADENMYSTRALYKTFISKSK